MLDRDWQCYSVDEREEAERFVEERLYAVARQLKQLLGLRAARPPSGPRGP